jgi:hypothetical protein
MESQRLTTEQARRLHEIVRPVLRFLNRLKARLDDRGFDPRTSLYVTVVMAADAVQRLVVELYYESCSSGVNRPDKE